MAHPESNFSSSSLLAITESGSIGAAHVFAMHPESNFSSSSLPDSILTFYNGKASIKIEKILNIILQELMRHKRFKPHVSRKMVWSLLEKDLYSCNAELIKLIQENLNAERCGYIHRPLNIMPYKFGSDFTRRMFEVIHKWENNMINIANGAMSELFSNGEDGKRLNLDVTLYYI
jgi:hypothetical protein